MQIDERLEEKEDRFVDKNQGGKIQEQLNIKIWMYQKKE